MPESEPSSDDEKPYAYYSAHPDQLPMHIEFIAMRTGEVVHRILVNGPGVTEVPPLAGTYGPVRVRLTFANGEVVESDP